MSSINFPDNPINGQQFQITLSDGSTVIWVYNSTLGVWTSPGSESAVVISLQARNTANSANITALSARDLSILANTNAGLAITRSLTANNNATLALSTALSANSRSLEAREVSLTSIAIANTASSNSVNAVSIATSANNIALSANTISIQARQIANTANDNVNIALQRSIDANVTSGKAEANSVIAINIANNSNVLATSANNYAFSVFSLASNANANAASALSIVNQANANSIYAVERSNAAFDLANALGGESLVTNVDAAFNKANAAFDAANTISGQVNIATSNDTIVRRTSSGAINASNFTGSGANLTSVRAEVLTGTVPTGVTWNGNAIAVLYGGTGATTAAAARTSLDVPSTSGTGATGTGWGISITGSAASLTTARTINGVSFNGTANINVPTQNSITFNNAGTGSSSGITFNGSSGVTVSYNTIGAAASNGSNASGTGWNISITGSASSASSATTATSATSATTAGSCTGNSATATKLATARTLNNVSFDGSANITVPVPNQAAQVTSLGVGTVASGTTGEIRATNNITAYYSDDRLKTRKGNIVDALEKVCSLNGFYYEANEVAQSLGYEKKTEVGVSAQEVQSVLPEVVVPAPIDEKYLTVRYEKIVPLLIEAIKQLKEEIEELKKR